MGHELLSRFLNVIYAFWNEKTGLETQPSNYLKT